MSESNTDTGGVEAAVNGAGTTDEAVAKFLCDHPEFFINNQELLADLRIPHACGGVTSLIERQIEVLRGENTRLKNLLDDLFTTAKRNQLLAVRLHRLTVSLLCTTSFDAIVTILQDQLRDDFAADNVIIHIYAEPAFLEGDARAFVGRGDPGRELFAGLLAKGVPCPGTLDDLQRVNLFGEDSEIGSAVLIPLQGRAWNGVLGVASVDKARFDQSLGTEMLTHLSDIASLIIDPWVAH